MNIIGDIAGQYDTLMALLKKMPDEEVLSVGDMIDRGPQSKQVLEWFMKNGKAILGNHEHLMLNEIDEGDYYSRGMWQWNGGGATLDSFGAFNPAMLRGNPLINWVRGLPLFVKLDGALVSHSFIGFGQTLETACDLGRGFAHGSDDAQSDRCILWNRGEPGRQMNDKDHIQIAGHNSQFGLRKFEDRNGTYAICIDDSRHDKLTGLHWPSMTIYQEDYHG